MCLKHIAFLWIRLLGKKLLKTWKKKGGIFFNPFYFVLNSPIRLRPMCKRIFNFFGFYKITQDHIWYSFLILFKGTKLWTIIYLGLKATTRWIPEKNLEQNIISIGRVWTLSTRRKSAMGIVKNHRFTVIFCFFPHLGISYLLFLIKISILYYENQKSLEWEDDF